MSRWVAKVERNSASSLRSSESVIAATFGQAPGSLWRQAIAGGIGAGVGIAALSSSLGALLAAALGGGVGGLIGLLASDLLAKRRSGGGSDSETGEPAPLASQVPTGRVMFAVTDQRMLFFRMSPLTNSPKQLLAEFDLSEAPQVNVDGDKKFVGSMNFAFSDHSTAKTEIVRAGKASLFADAVRDAATSSD